MAFTCNVFRGMNEAIYPTLTPEGTAYLIQDGATDDGKLTALRLPKITQYTDPTRYGHYGNANRSVVKWYGRYYWSDNVNGGYGGNVESLGIPYPEETDDGAYPLSIIKTSGTLTGKYKYCITFVNPNGWESAPGSDACYETDTITLENHFALLTLPTFPEGISYAKIWRTTADGATFYCVGESTTSGGTFTDEMTDTRALQQEELAEDMYGNLPPREGGKYLCEQSGVFYLAVGSSLYVSHLNNPHAWPTTNFISFTDTITGILPEFEGVLVFTLNATYRVVGATDIDNVSSVKIPTDQGCINWRSMAVLSNMPIWLGEQGICTWDGQSISCVSNNIMNLKNAKMNWGETYKSAYYLFMPNGTVIYDLSNGGTFTRLSFTADYAWYNGTNNNFYLIKNNYICVYAQGDSGYYYYVSPYLTQSEMAYQVYSEIIINATGIVWLSVYVDDKEILLNKKLEGTERKRIKLPVGTIGRRCQIAIRGNAKLTEYVVG